MPNLERFFKRRGIAYSDIMYIYRRDKRTVICCESGEEATCTVPVHDLYDFLPEGQFLSIAKGVLVNRGRIVHISNDGVYTMSDERTFQGRQRCLSAHKKIRKELNLDLPNNTVNEFVPPLGFFERCSIVDDMPVAYCVIELVFDENGHGVDFIFRYCNKHMAVVEGVPVEEMLNHSFYEVFKNGDRKWLIAYADVALNGVQRTLHDFSPEINQHLTIHCYRPEPGLCACVLVPETSTLEAKLLFK